MTVLELLSDPKNWCQGPAAKDKDGNKVDPLDDKAISWCLLGACCKCYTNPTSYFDKVDIIHKELLNIGVPPRIVEWNDSPQRKHSELLELLQKLKI